LNYVYQLPGQSLKGIAGVILGGWSYNGIWALQTGAHWEPYTSANHKLREITPSDPVNNPNHLCEITTTYNDISSGNCVNSGGDYNLDGGRNDRPSSSVSGFSGFTHNTWANGWCSDPNKTFNGVAWGGCEAQGGVSNQSNLPILTQPNGTCLGCYGNLGRNTFVGPGQWFADMALSKTFKFTERVSMKFDANAFNIFNHANFLLATVGGGSHNQPRTANFGTAAGTLNPRQLQFGVKISF
jgi:hypothetical protein